MSDADNRLMPYQATTKQTQAATTTMKTKIAIFILIRKLKADCVVVLSLVSLTIDCQVESKGQKEREVSLILGQRSLFYRHRLNGTQFH
jgi:hypothetical protein